MVPFRNSAVRAVDIAMGYVQREEARLRLIIESEQKPGEDRFQALMDLAYLSGVVVRELADMRTQSEVSGTLNESTELLDTIKTAVEPEAKALSGSPATEEMAASYDATAMIDQAEFCHHKDVCDGFPEGVYFVDKKRRITYWNQGAKELSGFDREDAIGRYCHDNFLKHTDAEGRNLCHLGCPLAETLNDGKAREGEVFLHHKSGHKVPVAVRVSPVFDRSSQLIGAVEVFSNITSRKELENRATELERRSEELEKLAYSDCLTGLSNRRHIQLKLEQAQQEVNQFGRKAGLLLLDIDDFKMVNDAHGHDAGDNVLKVVSSRLKELVRIGDSIGRWGGEEFLYVAMNVTLSDLEEIGERCRRTIESCSIPLDADQVSITISIGAAIMKKETPYEAALKRADELLYVGKCQGGNVVRAKL
jgi:diguanylate cyclase (GGDEF)-like protein/PAS domain S-box-containing protein